MKKVIKILIILTCLFCLNTNVIYATDNWSEHGTDWWRSENEEVDVGQNELKDKANVITKVIRNIGIIVAVISLMIIGIKELFASAEQKSKYKESLPGYLIGIVMVIAVSLLPSLIYDIVKSINL